jgi:tryptophan-rich sensory protein
METFLRQPAAIATLWVLATLALNGFIFFIGWNTAGQALRLSWAPPGAVIGAVWVGLFAAVGYAHGLLVAQSNPRHWLVAALLLACLAYPLYTGGLQAGQVAFYGTLATLGGTLAVLWQLRSAPTIPWLLLPLALWLSFAACLIWATLQLNP